MQQYLEFLTPRAIAQWSMIVLAALTPFFVFPISSMTVVQSKMMLLAIMVPIIAIAWAYDAYKKQSISVSQHPLLYAAKLLPVVYLISALVAGLPSGSFVSGSGEQSTVIIIFFLFALMAFVANTFDTAHNASRALLRALIIGGSSLLILQIIHLVAPSTTFGVLSGSASSVVGSWHDYAIVLGFFVILSLVLIKTSIAVGLWRKIIIALGIASLAFLFVVNMRDVWYGLAAATLALTLLEWLFTRRDSGGLAGVRRSFALPLAIGVISALSGVFAPTIYNSLPAPLQVAQIEVRPSWQGTFAISKEGITGTSVAVFGSGPNTFTHAWSQYKPVSVNETNFWNVDFNSGVGLIPTTFVTVGLLGVIAWFLVCLALLWSLYRFVRSMSFDPERQIRTVLYVAALYLTAFHIMYVPSIALSVLTFVVYGLIIAYDCREQPRLLWTANWNGWGIVPLVGFGLAVLLIVIGSVSTLRVGLSDILVNRSAVLYAASSDAGSALSSVQKALLVYPSNDRAHRAAVELGLIQLQKLAESGKSDSETVTALQGTLQRTIAHGLTAVAIDGADYQNWLSLAGLYKELAGAGVAGADESARAAYAKAIEDSPSNPIPFVQLAQLDLVKNDLGAARTNLGKAIALKSDLALAYYLRSQVAARENDIPAAQADALTAAQYAQQDPLAWYNLGALYYAAGSYEQAVQPLVNAVALQNNYANALFVLGMSYEKLGKHQEALTILKRVQALNPDEASLKSVIAEIEKSIPAPPAGSPAP